MSITWEEMKIKYPEGRNTMSEEREKTYVNNSDGDKGIIIAKSIEEAKKIFHEKYPERKIVDNYYDYCKNGAYLFEMSKVDNIELPCLNYLR